MVEQRACDSCPVTNPLEDGLMPESYKTRSLVERVAAAIHPSICPDPNLYLQEAKAAILEVALWLSENSGGTRAAWMLENEAER